MERGDYLERTEKNWSAQAVFVDGHYQGGETWTNARGETFSPALHYYVGGNSKVYGAALFRLRERDFGEVVHAGGISPAWPVGYDVFEPYYAQAERLFHVHGLRSEDPLESWAQSRLFGSRPRRRSGWRDSTSPSAFPSSRQSRCHRRTWRFSDWRAALPVSR